MKNSSIVYATLDINYQITNENRSNELLNFLKLTVSEKKEHIKNKINTIYEELSKLHPDSTIMIIISECAISPVVTLKKYLSCEEKDAIIGELKSLTKNKNLILIPGSFMFEMEKKGEKTIYNHSVVLAEDKIVGTQAKMHFGGQKNRNSDLFYSSDHKGKGKKEEIIHISTKDGNTLSLLISLCRDHHKMLQPQQIDVDIHLILSNTTFFEKSKRRGTMTIHCDTTRPTLFYKDTDDTEESTYVVPLSSKETSIYHLGVDESKNLWKKEKDASRYQPPELPTQPVPFEFNEIYHESNLVNQPQLITNESKMDFVYK